VNDKPATPRTPLDILEAALRKEKAAYHFYGTLLGTTTVRMVEELLEELRDAERQHVLLIEKKIAALKRG
jgi:rubrerythrin